MHALGQWAASRDWITSHQLRQRVAAVLNEGKYGLQLGDEQQVEEILDQREGRVPVGGVCAGQLDAPVKELDHTRLLRGELARLGLGEHRIQKDAHRQVERALLLRVQQISGLLLCLVIYAAQRPRSGDNRRAAVSDG